MGLFDKKICSICGGKIGLLGNRKLDDGNLCKECASKLSPFFSERRSSTVEQIREQLAYREENKAKVAAFQCSRTLGGYKKVLVDEAAGVFMVTNAKKLLEANPDVIPISAVTGCSIKPEEHRWEVYRKNEKGESESYNPRRYKYEYDIGIVIYVNHPYFSEISFDVNTGRIDIGEPKSSLFGGQAQPKPEENMEYARCMREAEEIRSILMRKKTANPLVKEKEKKEKKAVKCPACGAVSLPDENGCCEYCGTPLV